MGMNELVNLNPPPITFPQPYLLELGHPLSPTPHPTQTLQWNAEPNYWVWLGPEWGCSQDLILLLSE